MSDDTISQIIQSSIASQYVFSKVRFDNAKDTKALHFAASENADNLQSVIDYKVRQRVEQLLVERLESSLADGKLQVRLGESFYTISPLAPTNHHK